MRASCQFTGDEVLHLRGADTGPDTSARGLALAFGLLLGLID